MHAKHGEYLIFQLQKSATELIKKTTEHSDEIQVNKTAHINLSAISMITSHIITTQ